LFGIADQFEFRAMATFGIEQLSESLRNAIGKERYSPQILSALKIAFAGHEGQLRDSDLPNGEKVPYIVHPVGVAMIASELWPLARLVERYDDVISAALAHDLLEDTSVTASQLERATSGHSVELVQTLTKPLLSGPLSSQQRLDLFIDRIAEAGPAASFIKICDMLHNVSRPKATPDALLRKLLSRAKTSYERLFDHPQFDPALRDEYNRRLLIAERSLPDGGTYSALRGQVATSLADAVNSCVKASTSKTLERHDIVGVLRDLSGADFVSISTLEEFGRTILARKDKSSDFQKLSRDVLAALGAGELVLTPSQKTALSETLDGVRRIVTASIELGSSEEGHLRIFVGLQQEGGMDWFTSNALAVLGSYLSDRLRQMSRNKRNDISSEISRLGLDLDAEEAVQFYASAGNLEALRKTLDNAAIVCEILSATIRFGALKKSGGMEVELFESRIKSPKSIVRKFGRRKLRKLADVEDVVGLRVVCRSPSHASSIAERIQKLVAHQNLFGTVGAEDSRLEIALRQIATSDSYRAIHLNFVVRPKFQDAWARASHSILYASGPRNNEKIKSELKKLADLAEEADKLLSKFD
jgi:ppGpp synthetase/RelA/SpoT-type nucleotidyltranferase